VIISKTPFRISLAGGGTDLRSYYKFNDYGAVLSVSIDSYLYVSVKEQSSLFHGEYRLNYSETELVKDPEQIKNPIMRECIKFMNIDEKLYIGTVADVPASSGLGSSSTFCVGLLNALYKFKSENVSVGRLAEEAAYIECDVLSRPMGKQDHYAAAYGGINYFSFHSDESVSIRPVIMTLDNLKLLSESIMMFWTGLTRPSESVLVEQNKNSARNCNILTILKEQAYELSRTLSGNDISIVKIGDTLNKGWEYKKQLGTSVSNKKINDWYSNSLNYGALGGKISGAGGGGFLTLIVDKNKQKILEKKLKKEGLDRHHFGIDSNGTVVYEIN
jgi:D-glycero-alpha-D-manno-heptose-7-phosphate kinase